ncbi:phosphofructokinase [Salinimicrobium marinum]|uniref:Phosphofructokinase n=1 Tax=Salinimicrobium marinum TaxID=680283 RepID=A0A918VX34_9FLAO|nr:1-phosphofructokinase family hexose kinase [Salinimicrobium marinum]GHA37720.1 phosphofructokinase [Salinimicrobium marinum]
MILTLTVNPALDIYTTVEHIESNEKLRCKAPKNDPGGGGVNVSRVIKRLGGDSTAVYTKGGYTGDMFHDLLEQEGIRQDTVQVKNNLRQNFAVTETSTGKLYRFGMPGAPLAASEYEAILEKIDAYPEAEFLVASGSLPPGAPEDFYARVAKRAKKNNIKFILDTSGKAFSEVLKEGAYLLKPNMRELRDLTGQSAESEQEQKELLLEVLEKHDIEVIVASLGANGAYLAKDGKVQHFPAPSVEHISSIGAGDSMVAGIVYSLSRGNPVDKAVLYGLACGSATIKSPGTELLQKEDVVQLYSQMTGDNK